MKDDVTHHGTVSRVADGMIEIRVDGDAAKCDGCAVTALCNRRDPAGDTSAPVLTISIPPGADFAPGDRVVATATSGSTLRAVWWSLVLPTFILVGIIMWCTLGYPDMGAWSLAAGLVGVAVYDFFLFLFRRRLAARITWKITKLPTI